MIAFKNNISKSKTVHLVAVLLFLCMLSSCKNVKNNSTSERFGSTSSETEERAALYILDSLFTAQPKFVSTGFDFPVGKPNAKGYYNAQKFTENNHLGDDWNGVGGGNTDLGDPIYTVSNGYVSIAKDYEGGWGNVVRIIHKYNDNYYESIYAHCDKILIKSGNFVTKGTQIGTIGNVNGLYYAHLHFEIRTDIGMDIGGGYSTNTKGFLDPTAFINANR